MPDDFMQKVQTRQSIKNKLTLVIMGISVLLLVIVSFVVLTAELFGTRMAMIQEIRALSAALGTNSRQSLVLGQYQEAEKILQALSTQPHIHAAYLFDRRGEAVAEYLPQKDASFAWQYLEQDFSTVHSSSWTISTVEQINSSFFHLGVFTPIFYDGNRVGTLYVLSDLDPLYGRVSGVAFGIILSLFLLFVFSLFLAARLQKPIIDPLLNLAGVMEKVSAQKDYSVRAKKMTNDEIALLVDGLNHMLDQVEEHQRQQLRLQEHLELTVDQRTAELRAAVVDLEKARRRADAANEAKSQFLSRMTHELRTPLIGVLGMNGLLQRTSLTEHQQALADTVEKSGNDLLALIGDVLDIARIEAGVVELNTEEVEPARIIEEVVDLLGPQAHSKGIELLTDIPVSALWSAKGDRARIWQVLMNLVGNAIKFTVQGQIVVRLNVILEEKNTGRFVIEVEDTGVGMDKATTQHVFDLFYQHETVSAQGDRGSGLGLPIVRQLVDLMEGKVSVTSQPGAGSCFTVELSLPLLASSHSVVAPEHARVVFVGRHAAQRQLLRLALTSCPVALACVDVLDDGVALSRGSDVVLMILDAADVTETELRDLAALKKRLPPCYLLSDHDLVDQVIPQLAGRLRKPVSKTALQEIIHPLLEQGETLGCAVAGESV